MTAPSPYRFRLRCVPLLFALGALLMPRFAAAETPVGWRTDGTGRYPQANPPLEWAADRHVVWKVELPDNSHATPVVAGPRIFVVCEPAEVLCFQVDDGQLLWRKSTDYSDVFEPEKVEQIKKDHAQAAQLQRQQREVRRKLNQLQKSENATQDEIEEAERQNEALTEQIKQYQAYPAPRTGPNGNTTATPVSDGRRVFVAFGTGIVSCFTLEGERVWTTFVEPPTANFGHSASPLLVDDKILVHYDNLVALDAESGKTSWTADVPSRFGSPIMGTIGETRVVITAGGAIVRSTDGHVLADKLFRLGHNSPILHDGVIYVFQSGNNSAFRLPESAGDEVVPILLWKARGFNQRTFASPVYHDGVLYTVTENNIMDAIDAATGELVYRTRLNFGNGRVYPSVTLAGGYLFASSDNGTTLVFEPGRKYREVARNTLDGIQGSPVFVDKRLYIRSKKYLYCIEDTGE